MIEFEFYCIFFSKISKNMNLSFIVFSFRKTLLLYLLKIIFFIDLYLFLVIQYWLSLVKIFFYFLKLNYVYWSKFDFINYILPFIRKKYLILILNIFNCVWIKIDILIKFTFRKSNKIALDYIIKFINIKS